MEYTKGEWHIIKDTDGRLHIMSKGKDTTMSINVAKMPVSPDAQANAHLIAAAPDLEEALETLIQSIDDEYGLAASQQDGYIKGCQALAKARVK